MELDVLWWFLSVALIGLGVAGTVLPALPGTALVLVGIVLAAWIDDFSRVGAFTLTIVGILAVLSWVLDYVAGMLGAKRAGASKQAIIGAAVGTVAGIFFGFIGVLVLPLAAAAVGEYLAYRDHRRAVHVGVATWIGMMIGIIAKVVLAFMMLGVFVVALIF